MILAILPTLSAGAKDNVIPVECFQQINEANLGKVIILDASNLPKGAGSAKKNIKYPVKRIEFVDLLRDGTPEYSAIQAMAQSTSSGCVLVLDTTPYSLTSVYELLDVMRVVWFHRPEWPKALFIICDEGNAVNLARHMARSFLIPSIYLSNSDIQKRVKKIRYYAKVLGFFGNGRIIKFAYPLYGFVKNIASSVRKYVE